MTEKLTADQKAGLAALLDGGLLDGETREGEPTSDRHREHRAWVAKNDAKKAARRAAGDQ